MERFNARILLANFLDNCRGSVVAPVVNQNNLVHIVPVQIKYPTHQRADIHLFVVARNHEGHRASQ